MDTCWKSGTKVDTPSAGIRRGLQLLPVAVIQLMLEHAAARGAEVGRVARGIAERWVLSGSPVRTTPIVSTARTTQRSLQTTEGGGKIKLKSSRFTNSF